MTDVEVDDPPAQPPPTINVALYYASVGLRVFPLQPGSKIPHKGTRGLLEASSDPDIILNWWLRWPGSNLAIATGHLVSIWDVDGPVGVKSWATISEKAHPTKCDNDNCTCLGVPTLGIVSTPRYGKAPRGGGNHIYVANGTQGNKTAIFPGIDYRGVGGYVVAPPSVMPDGTRYRWRRPLRLTNAT